MDLVEQPTNTRVCIACALEISSKALKCPQCGTFQNWRRKLTFSSTVLSLLIALISVIGLVLPTIMDTFVEGASLRVELDQRRISFQRSRGGPPGNKIVGLTGIEFSGTLIISNTGDRSAYLHSVEVVLRVADGPSNLLIMGKSVRLPFTKSIQVNFTNSTEITPGRIYFAKFEVWDELKAFTRQTDEEYNANESFSLDFTGTQLIVELIRHDLSREKISLPLDFDWAYRRP
jgi:hypothetical protein